MIDMGARERKTNWFIALVSVVVLASIPWWLPAQAQVLPAGSIPVASSANGTTGATVATLAASPGRTTWICGLQVSAAGTATISPITVAGLLGGSMIIQGISAGGAPFGPASLMPCIPASTINTAITVTTTADGTATAVNVTAWGYQTLDR